MHETVNISIMQTHLEKSSNGNPVTTLGMAASQATSNVQRHKRKKSFAIEKIYATKNMSPISIMKNK